jgi:hypothetical protein
MRSPPRFQFFCYISAEWLFTFEVMTEWCYARVSMLRRIPIGIQFLFLCSSIEPDQPFLAPYISKLSLTPLSGRLVFLLFLQVLQYQASIENTQASCTILDMSKAEDE